MHGLATLLLASGLLGGCAEEERRPAPVPALPAMPYSIADDTLAIGAEPQATPEQQSEIFGADLAAASVLPIHVIVMNRNSAVLPVEPVFFSLSVPGGEAIAPRPGSEVGSFFPPEAGLARYATTGVAVLGGLAGPIGAIAGRIAGFLGGLMLNRMDSDDMLEREDAFARQELRSVRLPQGGSARGYLFFVIPRGTPEFDEAVLSFQAGDEASKRLALPLKGFKVKAVPKMPHSPFAQSPP